ncbi:type VI secretion system baseplate subunit TssK [Janthinobacterium fluminis]|uniref:Type VI secretion system baseplate subunit TssK n=1 Tax=Janthinobacterium fluminis TaxID=2987524 RepID=A0ABT5JYF2_9BURK|nr:type VI secretion system baseplate subunit TssK [Janthinobacterium fluminis]MDC8757076.1 type VI secretion system baseplate subunit TssK [Janthinobacterium fluminis]
MNFPAKVLWSEGLTLGPQQLQQQDRYHEARLRKVAATINPNLWGVYTVLWNVDALAHKLLRADRMSLLFQDGELYEAPDADPLPAPVDLSALPPAETSFTFYAALPLLKPYGGNLADADAARDAARYTRVEADTADLFTDALNVDVAYLRNTVQLLAQAEPRGAYANFPVVRLRRLAAGGFELDPGFMPPCVSIGAAAGLRQLCDNLLGKLKAKIDSLYALQRQPNTDVIEVHSGDIATFWMLHTISTASAALCHYARAAQQHPERLYVELLALAGGLMAFSKKYTLDDLPAYEHGDPAPAFSRVDAIIRDLVDTVISSSVVAIPLWQDENKVTHYRGTLDALKEERKTALIIAVNADMPALELVAMVPTRFKVGSPEDVEQIVTSALPGVTLTHMPQVPGAVPVRPSTYYFAVSDKGALYERMLKARAITIYVPSGMKDLQLELLALAS